MLDIATLSEHSFQTVNAVCIQTTRTQIQGRQSAKSTEKAQRVRSVSKTWAWKTKLLNFNFSGVEWW